MEIQKILNHYNDPEFIEFYRKYLGNSFMNVGIYKSTLDQTDYDTGESDVEDYYPIDKKKIIREAMNKKNDLLLFFIKNYINPAHTGTVIIDMGGGMGGTMRNLFKIIKNARTDYGRNSDYSLYSYELSSENCSVNNLINFQTDSRVKIYNRDFLNTFFKEEAVNLIISEDTFHQVNDKEKLFNEIGRVLSANGHIIMSDIFLLEECSDTERKKTCEILGLSNILKQSEFLQHAVNHNIELINCLYYKSDLNYHYDNCYNLAQENGLSDKITDYFKKWIDASKYLTSGIFVFKKIY